MLLALCFDHIELLRSLKVFTVQSLSRYTETYILQQSLKTQSQRLTFLPCLLSLFLTAMASNLLAMASEPLWPRCCLFVVRGNRCHWTWPRQLQGAAWNIGHGSEDERNNMFWQACNAPCITRTLKRTILGTWDRKTSVDEAKDRTKEGQNGRKERKKRESKEERRGPILNFGHAFESIASTWDSWDSLRNGSWCQETDLTQSFRTKSGFAKRRTYYSIDSVRFK